MPMFVYTLKDAIDRFFSDAGASSSKIQCDDFVRRRYGGGGDGGDGGQIRPAGIQGVTSYTVIAGPSGNKIIQFREQTALLDMNMLELAKEIHGEVVPRCSELGWIGDPSGSPLAIYEMDRLHGENYIMARPSLTHDKRLNTVHSLASFFAQSWQKGKLASSRLANMSAISTECYARFEYLADAIPKRFLPAVTEIQAALPALLDGCYPVVLTHGDFNEVNILVDPDSGEITGVVDWPDASILPFGFALYALENALGSRLVNSQSVSLEGSRLTDWYF
ncbi:hypothetical protein CC80DRAFT_456045 [Byssothecium circinans]|uniref:Aminoglycoside phosphotransferase domain-containing protein n=1 Tax=Byssothecium circinans TaxID=147558 RepID=A0A6A5THJ8_9PLEO|nr:hypothetical protein CC80DRAFT_456045 [Byssothecium circinans]